MAVKKLVKPNVFRAKIFDKLAEAFGDSVLGMYENKLRIELVNEETGEIVQFSLAPVIHKTLVEEEECDKLVSAEDQLAAYDEAKAAKDAETSNKKGSSDKSIDKKNDGSDDKSDSAAPTSTQTSAPVELSEEETAKLNDITNKLINGEF